MKRSEVEVATMAAYGKNGKIGINGYCGVSMYEKEYEYEYAWISSRQFNGHEQRSMEIERNKNTKEISNTLEPLIFTTSPRILMYCLIANHVLQVKGPDALFASIVLLYSQTTTQQSNRSHITHWKFTD